MPRQIAATFDYRCPFARNGHEAIINALREGADLDVHFQAFSLDQAHVEEGEPPVWERDPGEWGTGTTALLYGIAVRDTFPERFLEAHVELFAQRHDHGLQLGKEDVVQAAIERVGLDVDAVRDEAWSGRPAQDARGRAHRGGRALVGVRGAHLLRGRGCGVHPLHGAGARRRPPPGARPPRLDPAQRVQAHEDPSLTARSAADVAPACGAVARRRWSVRSSGAGRPAEAKGSPP